MKTPVRIIGIIVLLAIAGSVIACTANGGSDGAATLATPTVKVARSSSEFSDIYEAQLKIATDFFMEHAEEVVPEDIKQLSEDIFGSANAEYKKGNYDAALEGYNDIIDAHPYHFGAQNNKTLALLQLEENDEALKQAMFVTLTFEDVNSYLNLQTATVAAGFQERYISTIVRFVDVYKKVNIDALIRYANDYNRFYDILEYGDLKQPGANPDSIAVNYNSATAELDTLTGQSKGAGLSAGDPDIEALRIYIDALFVNLGGDLATKKVKSN